MPLQFWFLYMLFNSDGINDVCLTPKCIRTASSLLTSMDTTKEPCDNFYNYVCGNWNKEHIIRDKNAKNNWFNEKNLLLERNNLDFLKEKDSDDEPRAIHRARLLFRACLDLDSLAENSLTTAHEMLTGIGLNFLPPIVSKPKQSLMNILTNAWKALNIEVLIGFALANNPIDRTILKLSVDIPKDHSILSLVKQKRKAAEEENKNDEEEENHLWLEETKKFLAYFYKVIDIDVTELDSALDKAAHDLMRIINSLYTIEKSAPVLAAKNEALPTDMNVKQLQSLVDISTRSKKSKIKWEQYFENLYADTIIQLDLERNDTILVYNKPYFQKLSLMLSKFNDRQIALYIWWKIMYTFAPHINDETAEMKKAIDRANGVETVEPREEMCAKATTSVMHSSVAYYLTKEPGMDKKIEKVSEMTSNIKSTFISLVDKTEWMDEITRARTIEKAKSMDFVIAFPEWMQDNENYDDIYESIEFNETAHLSNLFQAFESDSSEHLYLLREYFNVTGTGLMSADINAYYNQNENLIFVPAGILQFPFYDLGLEVLNYGAIGSILGHEVTHGFDDTGRLYDKQGNYLEWWTAEADKEYRKRAECFIDKFNDYYIPSVNRSINGNLTLGENLADSGGILEAFLAYKKYVEKYGEEPKLPGFQNYTHEQLFFLSYTHVWCSEYGSEEALLEDLDDEHAPEFARTVQTLRLSDEFLEAWNCPKESNMFPKGERCSLWTD